VFLVLGISVSKVTGHGPLRLSKALYVVFGSGSCHVAIAQYNEAIFSVETYLTIVGRLGRHSTSPAVSISAVTAFPPMQNPCTDTVGSVRDRVVMHVDKGGLPYPQIRASECRAQIFPPPFINSVIVDSGYLVSNLEATYMKSPSGPYYAETTYRIAPVQPKPILPTMF
jgi:hypothetical protein